MPKVLKGGYRARIRSRHPSHAPLRTNLAKMPVRTVIRLGSQTEEEDVDVEINTIEAIKNSSSKLRMKNCFEEGNVRTAQWTDDISEAYSFEFPVVTKQIFGSRGRGNSLIQTATELKAWAKGKNLSEYIFEKFYNYNREYRLHVTADGCFYTCRKMLKNDTPESKKWFRNDSNSVWVMESNEQFDRPTSWDKIVTECVKALNSCGLDFGACDVRVQSAKDKEGKKRKDSDFIIIEINSAPSFGDVTLARYLEMLPNLVTRKLNK